MENAQWQVRVLYTSMDQIYFFEITAVSEDSDILSHKKMVIYFSCYV